jgi:hypothetical protein
MTDHDLTKFIDEYYDARPQLSRPAKNKFTGYALEPTIQPLLESLYQENQLIKREKKELLKSVLEVAEDFNESPVDLIISDLHRRKFTIAGLICNNEDGQKVILGYNTNGTLHFISEPASCIKVLEQKEGRMVSPICTIGTYIPNKTVKVDLDLDKPLKAGNDKPKSTFWSYFKFTRKTK